MTVMANNIKRIDFETFSYNSDGEPLFKTGDVSIIYNTDVISEEEVEALINTGKYEWDARVVVTTPERANNMKGPRPHLLNMYQFVSKTIEGQVFAETEREAMEILKRSFSPKVYNNIEKLYLFCDNIKSGVTVSHSRKE